MGAIVVFVMGGVLIAVGLYEIVQGQSDMLSERGWSAFIAGAGWTAAGVTTIAIGVAIRAVEGLRRALALPRAETVIASPVALSPAEPVRAEPAIEGTSFAMPAVAGGMLGMAAAGAASFGTPVLHAPAQDASEPAPPSHDHEWLERSLAQYSPGHAEAEAPSPMPDTAHHAEIEHQMPDHHREPDHHAPELHHEDAERRPEPEPETFTPTPASFDWQEAQDAQAHHHAADHDRQPEPTHAEAHEPAPTVDGFDRDFAPPTAPEAAASEPAHEHPPQESTAAVVSAHEEPASPVIGRYESEGTSYVMYADGSIDAQSESGVYRFSSMAELKAFIEG